MKQIISTLLFFSLVFAVLGIQNIAVAQEDKGNLTIVVIGFKNDNGDVKVALSNSAEDFGSKEKDAAPFRADSAPIKDKKAEIVFNDLPFGEYAVRLFHDKNGNGKLDTNFLGIPKEDYGFSNNARGSFGPPI